jgi:predicted MPP superfamily phosphohydrolase
VSAPAVGVLCALLVAQAWGALRSVGPPDRHQLLPAQARCTPAALARDDMVIEELTLAFARLPRQFNGLTVAVVSDLHAGHGHGTHAFVERLVTTVNGLHPDAIVLLGDLVHRVKCTPHFLPLLAQLRAPEGLWACLGNHEHEFMWYSPWLRKEPTYGVEEWRQWYASIGARLLANEARPLTRGGARLWLVGVDDPYTKRQDLPAALAQTRPGEFRLVLSHSPDLLDDPRISEVDLVLAGHTHGGQVWIPGVGPFAAPCRKPAQRAAGLVRHNGTTMYVSRGAGEGLRLRFGCPREVTLLTLKADPDAQ